MRERRDGGGVGLGLTLGERKREKMERKHSLLMLSGNETSQKADGMTNRQCESKRGQRLGEERRTKGKREREREK